MHLVWISKNLINFFKIFSNFKNPWYSLVKLLTQIEKK